MGKTVRVTLTIPLEFAECLVDPQAEPALRGSALAELILYNRAWCVGDYSFSGDDHIAVGVVLLVEDKQADKLLTGKSPHCALYDATHAGAWAFIAGHLDPETDRPVAVQGDTREMMDRAMDSLAAFRLELLTPAPAKRWRRATVLN